ncbi:LacI family DNA-binding transcriptional regulator [Cellulomonas marina]|uniref:LacI family transcriptional regulator n=1 Tax=Cellulomonas marina TaxID=988821 RepID=A0A1I1ALN1_9CELL|nr:LacI family DNA-binding transcriptional regulator [Cellulomonas marina]GIG30782.1 LacI family transcriptional regulator [Cellulomonas marina]SFB37398.1 LacI family transcriptional regulator [Cellulomonas marina]
MAGRGGVRIAEIAAAAGVSVPTVSKVLNGRPGVSAATRAQVEHLLVEHGYERRGRSGSQTVGLVDFVISDLGTQWATALLRGAEAEASRLGVGLVVTAAHGRPVGTPDWLEHVLTRGTDGVVLVVSELLDAGREELLRLRTPVVLVDPVGTRTERLPTVAATDWAGGRDATEHLLGLGHRRIGFVTGPPEQECHRDRLDGYRAALLRAGITPDPALVRHGDSLVAGGRRYGEELLRLPEPPTAIISGSDEQAYGVYAAARALGVDVPGRLSVVGFDDVDLCQWVTPPLTTVRQPLAGMAREATRMVVELSRGGEPPAARTELATSLVVRASTAPPPPAR